MLPRQLTFSRPSQADVEGTQTSGNHSEKRAWDVLCFAKIKTAPLSTGDPCNYESALSIHIWAESREVSASDWAGRNQIGDAVSPGLRRKLDGEGDSWPATISGGDHVAVMEPAESRQRDDIALARRRRRRNSTVGRVFPTSGER